MEERSRIFIACAFGAGIGAFLTLEIHPYFWWVGLIVGGFVGYLFYDLKEVIRAISQAVYASGGIVSISWKLMKRRFTDADHWRKWRLSFVHGLAFGSIFYFPFLLVLGWVLPPEEKAELLFILAGWILLVSTGAIIQAFFDAKHPWAEEAYQNTKDDILQYNMFTIYFYYPSRLLIRGLRALPKTLHELWRIVWHVFVLIHSERRLLCGLDAAIGAGVGYFSGNVLVGALAGGIVGLLNFEIVSKRILHLVPNS